MADRSTEARHPSSDGLHLLPAAEVLARLLAAQGDALQAVGPAIPALERAGEAVAAVLSRPAGRLGYVGAGSSGLMALSDCLELAGTFGIAPERTPMLFAGGTAALLHMTGAVEDDPALAADFARSDLAAGDAAICLSASGATPYTLAVARLAAASGVTVVGIANVAASPLLQMADIAVLLDTGPEVVSGSTRMGAATAQKVALNMLSVLIGIRLGHVHDGFMVNLVADNAKLRERAARMVSALSGADPGRCKDALQATGGAVKPAVLVARGRSAEEAASDLQRTAGRLAPLL